MFELKASVRLCGSALVLVTAAGCGISKQYVGANARTIRDSAEMTKKSLAACIQQDNCAAIAAHMNADLDQITDRAIAMCALAEPECEGAKK